MSFECYQPFSRRGKMEQKMAEVEESNFLSPEVDFDYEFDASRYFDFVREESTSEAWDAELWFEKAGSYPPSPFMSRIVLEKDAFAETINYLSECKDREIPGFQFERAAGRELYVFDDITKDPYQNEKRFVFGSSTRGSTLMKPTASNLAKQIHHRQVRHAQAAQRLRKPLIVEPVKKQNYEDLFENGDQAVKRQKLEGGVMRKIVAEKQQINLMHKIREKNKLISTCKLRLTIPREPELETAQRAQRMRDQRLWSNFDKHEEMTPASSSKSHPLKRQNFKLKKLERDNQHSVSASSSLAAKSCAPSKSREQGEVRPHLKCYHLQPSIASRFGSNDQKIHNNENILPKFTARPLNKKILSSKGDIGVFCSAKREATKPMEFKLSTNKRCQQEQQKELFNKEFKLSTNKSYQQDLPMELFNKLSLNSDVQPSSASLAKPLWSSHGSRKDSRWNAKDIMQQEHKAIYRNHGDSLKRETKLFGFDNGTFSYPRLGEKNMRVIIEMGRTKKGEMKHLKKVEEQLSEVGARNDG